MKGLKVRMYVPQDPTKKNKFPRPDYRATLGKEADGLFTPLEKCMDALRQGIKKLEQDEHTSINYALLIDGQAKENGFTVCPVSAKVFYDQSSGGLDTLTCRGVKYPILAVLECDEVRVVCEKEKFISYFTPKKNGDYHLDLWYHNYIRDVEIEEAEAKLAEEQAAKAAKKQAKKHRRQMTQPNVTSPSENSVVLASQSVEDDDAVKERQRENNRIKKKAQRERRRAKKDQDGTAKTEVPGKERNDSDGNKTDLPTIEGVVGTHLIVKTGKEANFALVPRRSQIAPIDLADPRNQYSGNENVDTHKRGGKSKPTTIRRISSSSESDDSSGTKDTEESTGLRVIPVSTTAEMNRLFLVTSRAGGTTMIAWPKDESDGEVEETDNGLKYLGRGL